MVIKEFGKNNKEVIILLHGGGLSWWNYRDVALLLEDRYHVIIPILDGHSGSDNHFSTIKDNALRIIKYIEEKCDGHINLIGGLSLGAQILLEILSIKKDICDYAIVESALVKPMKITKALIKPSIKMSYWMISKKWFAKMQFKSLKIRKELFEDYYNDSKKIAKDDMINFLKENLDYHLNDLKEYQGKCLVLVGKKERKIMLDSAKMISKALNQSKLQILEGFYHGDLSINHSNLYVKYLENLLND